jgi:uncharacterized phage infection (PIP) family protein YhgE
MAENGPIEIGVRVNTDQATRSIDNFSKQSRTALTSLSLVLQDLPFGFIGIQNNLPGLIQGFNELKLQTGSTKNAILQLAASISGPAGLLLGYSAAISLTTVLVQKYGSLDAALDAFIGKTRSAADIQNKLNKELEGSIKSSAGEIANLNSLVSVLTNVNSTRSQQVGAYQEINKQYPGLLANINSENAASATSISLLSARLELYKQQIILEGRREALIKLVGESALEGEKAISALTNRDNLGFFDKLGLELRGLFAGIGGLGVINVLNQDLGNAAKSVNSYNERLQILNNELSKVNGEIVKLVDTQKKEAQSSKEAAKRAKELAEARKKQFELLGDIRKLRNEKFLDFDPTLKPIKKVDAKAYVESFSKSLQNLPATNIDSLIDVLFPEKDFKIISDAWGKINKDTAPKLEEFKNQIRDALISKELTTGVKTSYDDIEKAITEAIGRIQTTISQDSGITQRFQDAVNKGANEFARLKEEIKQFEDLQSSIQQNLERPFRSFFDDLLENGKVAFDNFEKLVKDSLKRILAQAIATGLAQLLASLLSGGGTTAITKLAAGAQISKKLGDLSKIGGLFTRVAAPSFGGVGGGPLQMAGAVNLSLRGSDLVASINRTNSTINRVG